MNDAVFASKAASVSEALAIAGNTCPDNLAIADDQQELSYSEFCGLVERFAGGLSAAGVESGDRVALSMGRTWRLPVAIAGVLRAGCCYVPVDPSYPPSRQDFILTDSEPAVVISDSRGPTVKEATAPGKLTFDQLLDGPVPAKPVPFPVQDSRAYIIYTSGSTGTPKGVQITHGNLMSLFRAVTGLFDFGTRDRWALFHSYNFDFSVWELWGALLYGGSCVVVPSDVAMDSGRFFGLLKKQKITVLNQVPSVFAHLFNDDAARTRLSLRWLIFGGEALDRPSTLRFLNSPAGAGVNVVNMYGITETTIHTTYKLLSLEDLTEDHVRSPIGKPLPHLQMSLRDPNGRPVADDSVGEIYISGPAVAQGYWRRHDLTAERFVTLDDDPRCWYRSGDLALRLTSGEYEYRGRNDAQVKVRGFRIEIGEVEAAFTSCPDVQAVAAGVENAPDGVRLLVLYYVPAAQAPGDLKGVLRDRAREALPWHMRPTKFKVLASLPLTSSGKLDRRRLASAAGAELQEDRA